MIDLYVCTTSSSLLAVGPCRSPGSCRSTPFHRRSVITEARPARAPACRTVGLVLVTVGGARQRPGRSMMSPSSEDLEGLVGRSGVRQTWWRLPPVASGPQRRSKRTSKQLDGVIIEYPCMLVFAERNSRLRTLQEHSATMEMISRSSPAYLRESVGKGWRPSSIIDQVTIVNHEHHRCRRASPVADHRRHQPAPITPFSGWSAAQSIHGLLMSAGLKALLLAETTHPHPRQHHRQVPGARSDAQRLVRHRPFRRRRQPSQIDDQPVRHEVRNGYVPRAWAIDMKDIYIDALAVSPRRARFERPTATQW